MVVWVMFTVFCLGVSSAAVDPEADKVLKEMSTFFQGLKSVQYTSRVEVRMAMPGMNRENIVSSTVAVQKPNNLKMDITMKKSAMSTISDGSRVVFYVPRYQTWHQMPAPKDLDSLLDKATEASSMIAGDAPFATFFLKSDPYAEVVGDASEVAYLGVEDVSGTACHHLKVVWESEALNMWFRQGENPVPMKIVPDMEIALEKFRQSNPGFDLVINISLSDWEINPAIPAGIFTFTPEEGMVERNSLMKLVQPRDPREELIGKSSPKFTAPLLSGGQFNLEDALGKQVVVLDFWATWCGPCVAGLPILASVTNQFKDQGVVFVAINQGENEETVRQFMERKELDIQVAMDPESTIGENYFVRGIPQTVLIGKDGTVQEVHLGLAPFFDITLRREIESLLAGETLIRSKKEFNIEDSGIEVELAPMDETSPSESPGVDTNSKGESSLTR